VRLPVTASKLNKSFTFAGNGSKKRATMEGFAEENFSRRLRRQQEVGVIVKWQHATVGKP
jgi:hypothetical protein